MILFYLTCLIKLLEKIGGISFEESREKVDILFFTSKILYLMFVLFNVSNQITRKICGISFEESWQKSIFIIFYTSCLWFAFSLSILSTMQSHADPQLGLF